MLTKRQHDILTFIHKYQHLTVQDICREFSLSDKTVRNEIKSINILAKTSLILSSNRGIEMDQAQWSKCHLLQEYQTNNEPDDCHRLIMILLFHEMDHVSLDELYTTLYISSNALQKLIHQSNQMLEAFHMKIIKKHNCLSMQGTPQEKRRLLVSLIMEENKHTFCSVEAFADAFDHIDAQHILTVVEQSVKAFGFLIPTHYYSSFMLNIFSIFSLYKQEQHEEPVIGSNQEDIEYRIAEHILQALHMPNHASLLYDIASVLTGIINHNKNYAITLDDSSNAIAPIIKKALENTFRHFDLIIEFDRFYASFINHVRLMIKRAKTSNWFLDDSFSIKDANIFIYDIALYFCNQINHIFHISISEAEVSLIAIHLGYAIEESFEGNQKLYLALLCEEHEMVDAYIMQKLQHNFSEEIELVKIKDLYELTLHPYDLIVTTKEYPEIHQYPYCLITPLLTESDKNKIQKAILEALDQRAKQKFKTIIKDYFDEHLFFYGLHLHHKDEVLRHLDAALRKEHVVDEDFLGQIQKREQLSPTSFMDKFAIPHPFNCTALSSKIAVLIEPDGIDWGNGSSVQCVFLIAIAQKDQAMLKNLFDGLAMMLCDESKMLKISNVTSYEQLLDIMME